jgi:hypothetical protein
MSWNAFRLFMLFLVLSIGAYFLRSRYLDQTVTMVTCRKMGHVWVGTEQRHLFLQNQKVLDRSHICESEEVPRWVLFRVMSYLSMGSGAL